MNRCSCRVVIFNTQQQFPSLSLSQTPLTLCVTTAEISLHLFTTFSAVESILTMITLTLFIHPNMLTQCDQDHLSLKIAFHNATMQDRLPTWTGLK